MANLNLQTEYDNNALKPHYEDIDREKFPLIVGKTKVFNEDNIQVIPALNPKVKSRIKRSRDIASMYPRLASLPFGFLPDFIGQDEEKIYVSNVKTTKLIASTILFDHKLEEQRDMVYDNSVSYGASISSGAWGTSDPITIYVHPRYEKSVNDQGISSLVLVTDYHLVNGQTRLAGLLESDADYCIFDYCFVLTSSKDLTRSSYANYDTHGVRNTRAIQRVLGVETPEWSNRAIKILTNGMDSVNANDLGKKLHKSPNVMGHSATEFKDGIDWYANLLETNAQNLKLAAPGFKKNLVSGGVSSCALAVYYLLPEAKQLIENIISNPTIYPKGTIEGDLILHITKSPFKMRYRHRQYINGIGILVSMWYRENVLHLPPLAHKTGIGSYASKAFYLCGTPFDGTHVRYWISDYAKKQSNFVKSYEPLLREHETLFALSDLKNGIGIDFNDSRSDLMDISLYNGNYYPEPVTK